MVPTSARGYGYSGCAHVFLDRVVSTCVSAPIRELKSCQNASWRKQHGAQILHFNSKLIISLPQNIVVTVQAVIAVVRLLLVVGRYAPTAVAVLSSYNAQVRCAPSFGCIDTLTSSSKQMYLFDNVSPSKDTCLLFTCLPGGPLARASRRRTLQRSDLGR